MHALMCMCDVQEPEASLEGLGGTYFFMNEAGKRSAIVKPCDEEPLAPCNPKVRPCVPLFVFSPCACEACRIACVTHISKARLGRPAIQTQLEQAEEPLNHAIPT